MAPRTGRRRRPRRRRGRPGPRRPLNRGLAAAAAAAELDAAHTAVRTARALFGGALPETAAALCAGAISPAHAQVVADGTRELADHVKLDAEPILLDTARRVDPPRLRQAVAHLVQVADPEGADRKAERCQERRGLWLSPTWQDMVAVNGLLDPEAGSILLAALEPLARRPTPAMTGRAASATPTR